MILSAYYHSRSLLLISTNNMAVSKLNSCHIILFKIALGNDFKIIDIEELSICSAFSLLEIILDESSILVNLLTYSRFLHVLTSLAVKNNFSIS